jgi:hypothetical protein
MVSRLIPSVSVAPAAIAGVAIAIKVPKVVIVVFMAFSFRLGVMISFLSLCLYVEHQTCHQETFGYIIVSHCYYCGYAKGNTGGDDNVRQKSINYLYITGGYKA